MSSQAMGASEENEILKYFCDDNDAATLGTSSKAALVETPQGRR